MGVASAVCCLAAAATYEYIYISIFCFLFFFWVKDDGTTCIKMLYEIRANVNGIMCAYMI